MPTIFTSHQQFIVIGHALCKTTFHQQFIAVCHALCKMTTSPQQFIAVNYVLSKLTTPAVYCGQSCVMQADNLHTCINTHAHTHTHTHTWTSWCTHTHTHTHTQTTHKHTPTNACTQPHKQEHTVRAFCTTLFTRKLYMWQQNLAVDERSLDHRNTLHQAGDQTVFSHHTST